MGAIMKRFSGCVFLMSILLTSAVCDLPAGTRGILVPIETSEGRTIDLYHDSYALVVGNGNYTGGWDVLPGAIRDATDVAQALEKQGFRVTLKTDMTRDQFDDAFADFVYTHGNDKDNRLLFYYAGHGHTRQMATDEQLGYLVMVDAPKPEDFRSFSLHSIDMVRVVTQAKMIHAKHVLFMFDSCFSGTVLNMRDIVTPRAISENIDRPVRQFITAGSANEPVPDYSVFKQSFLDILEGREEEPIHDGYLTGEELALYLKNKVPLYNPNQHPQYGKIRDPKLDKGDFVFRLAASGVFIEKPSARAVPTLSVESNVSNANVYVDGLDLGKTPLYDVKVSPGKHRIRVEKMGYRPDTRQIGFRTGRSQLLSVYLVEKTPPREFTNSLGMVFAFIPYGTFMMGSPPKESGRDDDEDQHRVTLTKGFYMQTTEVTQGQWRSVMGNDPSYFESCGDDCPVEQVSWNDAHDFIRKLDHREGVDRYRLPTEAEWEYAARAGTHTKHSWGDDIDCSKAMYGNDADSSEDCCVQYVSSRGLSPDSTAPVRSYPGSAWGLYDMHGNVWEWCEDWRGAYPTDSVTDPAGPPRGSDRVIRGGSWDTAPGGLRSAFRGYNTPDSRHNLIGFRLVRIP